MSEIPVVTIDALMERYQVLLLDAYGVLVHLHGALPGARELIGELNRRGQRYYLLTNDASKLPETAAQRYRGFGLDLAAERIISAGSLLAPHFAAHGLVGKRCAVLGTRDSYRYVELAGGVLAAPGEPCDALVVCDQSGFPFLQQIDDVLSGLIAQFDRAESVQLILANPDLIYPKTERGYGITAGSIALMLEAGLRLRYPARRDIVFERLGKPHPAIFAEALRRAGTRSVVMIGDQIETDIRGANACGIDSALLAGGIAGTAPSDGDAPRPSYRLSSIHPAAPDERSRCMSD